MPADGGTARCGRRAYCEPRVGVTAIDAWHLESRPV